MRKSTHPTTIPQKQQSFRFEIRRKQIEKTFKLYRHELSTLTAEQSLQKCQQNFKFIENYIEGLERWQYGGTISNRVREYTCGYQRSYGDEKQRVQRVQRYCNQVGNGCESEYNDNERLQIIVKQLRDINCSHKIPEIFLNSKNLSLIIKLQNNQNLDRQCRIFIHEILLNISAINDTRLPSLFSPCPLTLQSLSLSPILHSSNNRYLLTLTFQLLSNLLIQDKTSKTIYYMITKLHIYKIILQFLIDKQRRAVYEVMGIQDQFMWFVNKVIGSVGRFKFGDIDGDFGNVVECVYKELEKLLDRYQYLRQGSCEEVKENGYKIGGYCQQNTNIFNNLTNCQHKIFTNNQKQSQLDLHQPSLPSAPTSQISINQLLIYYKTLIKSSKLELRQQTITRLQKYFSPKNLYYLDYLGSLTYYTLYSIPKQQLISLLNILLQEPKNSIRVQNILRCVCNSLVNDATYWWVVVQIFVKRWEEGGVMDQSFQVCVGQDDTMDANFGNGQYNQLNFIDNIETSNNQQYNTKHIKNNKNIYGLLSYFVYFLNNSKTERDMSQIIGIIICGQGGLGIFEDGIEYIVQSPHMRKKLESLGFQIEIQ